VIYAKILGVIVAENLLVPINTSGISAPEMPQNHIPLKAYFVPPVKITQEWMRAKNGATFVKRVTRQNPSPPRNPMAIIAKVVIQQKFYPMMTGICAMSAAH
jgi:hypothetical protein